MGLSFDTSILSRVIGAFTGGANTTEIIVQAVVAIAGIGLAFGLARVICTRVPISARWKFGKGDFERVAFALMALAFVWAGKRALEPFQESDSGPLEVVLSLLIALAVIRIASYVLGHVIPEGGLQRVVIRTVQWIAWIGVILHIVGFLPGVLDALDSHGIAFGKNKSEITLLDVLKGVAALFFSIVFALWLSRVTETRVMAADSMEMTTRVVIAKVVRIATIFLALFIALPMAGIDVTTLSILSGAVGVGLGFGLQKITSNYVSGFIVLLDHSLRIGDVVTVDGRRGEVKAIESRYTVIKGGDGVESIVPNEKLITDTVQHHTYSDPRVSIVIGVAVTYDTDVDRACALLHEIAKKHRRIIDDPPIAARVKQFTAHGVDLELTVWIKDPAVGDADLRSELLKDILRTFKAQRIEIPYPRRDVRILATGETPQLPVVSNT